MYVKVPSAQKVLNQQQVPCGSRRSPTKQDAHFHQRGVANPALAPHKLKSSPSVCADGGRVTATNACWFWKMFLSLHRVCLMS